MANLEIQGINVKCETSKYTEYRIEMHFKTPETKEGMLKSFDFYVSDVSSRNDLTYDRIEELINEKIEDMNLEITEISSINVKEVHKFKKSAYEDGKYYS